MGNNLKLDFINADELTKSKLCQILSIHSEDIEGKNIWTDGVVEGQPMDCVMILLILLHV